MSLFVVTEKASGSEVTRYDVVQAGDLDVAGDWQLQAYVEFPTWKGRGEVATMKVKNTI